MMQTSAKIITNFYMSQEIQNFVMESNEKHTLHTVQCGNLTHVHLSKFLRS